MDTKLIDWSKTILLCRSIMQRLLNAITKENEKMINLGYGSQHYDIGQNTYDFLNEMLSLNIRKRNLEELACVVDEILDSTDKIERKVLEERFFNKKGVCELLPKMNIRTVYRHYNRALSNFARSLADYGYTLEAIEEMFGKDKLIAPIHNRVVKHAMVFRSDEDMKPSAVVSEECYNVSEIMKPKTQKINAPLSRIDTLKSSAKEQVIGA